MESLQILLMLRAKDESIPELWHGRFFPIHTPLPPKNMLEDRLQKLADLIFIYKGQTSKTSKEMDNKMETIEKLVLTTPPYKSSTKTTSQQSTLHRKVPQKPLPSIQKYNTMLAKAYDEATLPRVG